MAQPLLHIDRLSLQSARGPVVSGLTLQVYPGEIVALTGRSGSGKTSIALAVLGLLPEGIALTGGAIRWRQPDGKELSLPGHMAAWSGLRGTHIGYTQQDPFGAFDPVMKMGRQMMRVVRARSQRPAGLTEKDLRIKMEETGLHDIRRLWNSYPHQLSGGQLQRCQIAMSIVTGPELLIADEPTSAIDRINQAELLEVFTMLSSKYNMAVLCITHEEAVVRRVAGREIRLDAPVKETGLVISAGDTAMHAHLSPPEENGIVLTAAGVGYNHAYGGLMRRKGASIGPVDITLRTGCCLGLAGESGSGKSTIAQVLVGVYPPLKGEVVVNDRRIDFDRVDDIRYLRSKVQLVMQDGRGSLHPEITIGRLFDEVIRLRIKSEPSFTTDPVQLLEEVGLPSSVLERTASQLSGGECLRVNIARALISGPQVLICDESTSALDAGARDGIIRMLGHLMQSRRLALLFITHDDAVIRRLSQEVMIMAGGRVVEHGRTAEVTAYPTHEITKKIFGHVN